MWPFKKKSKRIQPTLICTEDGRIIEQHLAVQKGYLVHTDTHQAWGLFPGSLILQKDTRVMYAILDERDAAPMCIQGKGITPKTIKSLISDIAKEARKQTQYEIQDGQNKDKIADAIRLAITISAILLVVVVIISLLFSGNLKLPF